MPNRNRLSQVTSFTCCKHGKIDLNLQIDKFGAKVAKDEIAMIKVVAPNVAANVTDRAIQIFGGEGVSQDTLLTLK